jgi:hypothetical protein
MNGPELIEKRRNAARSRADPRCVAVHASHVLLRDFHERLPSSVTASGAAGRGRDLPIRRQRSPGCGGGGSMMNERRLVSWVLPPGSPSPKSLASPPPGARRAAAVVPESRWDLRPGPMTFERARTRIDRSPERGDHAGLGLAVQRSSPGAASSRGCCRVLSRSTLLESEVVLGALGALALLPRYCCRCSWSWLSIDSIFSGVGMVPVRSRQSSCEVCVGNSRARDMLWVRRAARRGGSALTLNLDNLDQYVRRERWCGRRTTTDPTAFVA